MDYFLGGRPGKPAIFRMELAVLVFRPGIVAFSGWTIFFDVPSGKCGLFPDGLGLFQCVSAAEGIVEVDYSTDFVETVCGFCQLGLKKVLLG